MNDIDWSKAPDGATHYNTINDMFYMFPGAARGKYWSESKKGWNEAGYLESYNPPDVNYIAMVPRPTVANWDGQGLPQVGCICEYSRLGGEKFYSCEIIEYRTIAPHGEYVWLRTTEAGQHHVKLVSQYQFRPIRTPEQIAQDKRNAAVKEMVDRFAIYDIPNVPWRDLFAQMHDAGYRKVEDAQ